MTDPPEILVFGTTGQQGGALARALCASGRGERVFVRDPRGAKAQAVSADRMSVAVGDLFDRASIERAMAGNSRCVQRVDQLALGQCLGRIGSRTGKAIADSLVPAGVAHLLYSSGGAAGKGHTGMGHFDS